MARALILGAGDIGSAAALRLRATGHSVVLHDLPRPFHPRRGMSFTDAFFDEPCTLEGLFAKRASGAERLAKMLACGGALPVTDAELGNVIAAMQPDLLVDAHVHKHGVAPDLRERAPFTIGLGPGFQAGRNADIVIETAWGETLGRAYRAGEALVYAGEPRALGGHGRERYVYAAAAGLFRTTLAIGDAVQRGAVVAHIDDFPVTAPLTGILRGLTHDGARVCAGTKVVEVDPRGDRAAAFGVGERPARIALGVIEAIAALAERD